MGSVRTNLQKGALALVDVCTCLKIYATSDNLEKRLAHQANTHALKHITKALESKTPFICPGGTRSRSSSSITSPQELVHILHEFLLYNRHDSTKGGRHASTTVLSQRIDDFVANFCVACPGLWVDCDIRRLFIEATPRTTSPASSHANPVLGGGRNEEIPVVQCALSSSPTKHNRPSVSPPL
jgi:hypothetical protein